ncbi:Uncharacterised protein [Clostridioides difficile]|nr:Uncharacterised protein [Clostridioides difficile]
MSSLEFYNEVLDVENSIRKRKSKSKVSDKNILSDNIDLEMLKKLEKIRRSE